MSSIEQPPHAGQKRHSPFQGGIAIDQFLAFANRRHLFVVCVGVEECADDFGVSAAERRGEVGTREGRTDLGGQFDPRRKVQFGGIDQSAVYVPKNSPRG